MTNLLKIWIGMLLLILGCEPLDDETIYEEKLTVFANLEANLPLAFDTVFVSYSHAIDEKHEGNNKWVEDGTVYMIHDADTIHFSEVDGKPGRYVTPFFPHIVQGGSIYSLYVSDGENEVFSETEIPSTISLESVANDSLWTCHEDSVVDRININPLQMDELMAIMGGFGDSSLIQYDTVTYIEDECYTSSFASMPYFIIRWSSDSEPGMMRNIMISLENTTENFIVDTSFSAMAFKGEPFQDEEGNLYRLNPQVWNFSQQDIYFSWLAFNYYGLHLIIVQSTDQAFSEYYEGDPLSMNQYILPQSNIVGGYGLFTSTNSSAFFVYIAPEE